MKQKSIHTIFFKYCLHYKFSFLLLTAFTGFFIFFSYLSGYAIEGVLYGFLITYVLFFMIGGIHFMTYYRKHEKLRHIEKHITVTLQDLPPPTSLLEEDYQALLHCLLAHYRSLLTKQSKYQDTLLDYYSLWVHQIKTPISAMKLLLDTDYQDNNDKSLELQRIEQYVNMVLQFLRIDSMSSDLLIKSYDLDTLLHEVIKKLASFFINKKIRLEYIPTNKQIVTDAKWFTLVIEQILTNSLKYTNEGTISIYIDDTSLIIEDTGIGIQVEDLPRVFERGFTGYNGRMDKKSTGIGLYLCKRIMDNLQHDIQITSTIGVGTKVIINLKQSDILFE
jgi:signal transduction histidine kinase